MTPVCSGVVCVYGNIAVLVGRDSSICGPAGLGEEIERHTATQWQTSAAVK